MARAAAGLDGESIAPSPLCRPQLAPISAPHGRCEQHGRANSAVAKTQANARRPSAQSMTAQRHVHAQGLAWGYQAMEV